MATVRNQVLGIILLAGALVASADESGKAAAKANARGAGKGVTAKSSPIAPGPGRMQVEEPKADAAAPVTLPSCRSASSACPPRMPSVPR